MQWVSANLDHVEDAESLDSFNVEYLNFLLKMEPKSKFYCIQAVYLEYLASHRTRQVKDEPGVATQGLYQKFKNLV